LSSSVGAFAGLALLIGPLASCTAAPPVLDTIPVTAPAVWPTPHQQTARRDGFPVPPTVGLVTGSSTDAPAVDVVKKVLASSGVTRIVTASDQQPAPDAPLDVWIGGPSENRASAAALESLAIRGPDGLTGEGYVFGIGRGSDGHDRVVLAGADPTGTFYAAQTLRQLVVSESGRNLLPGVSIRDWPTVPLRGVIEGFYGAPWSTADRLSQFDFLGATKQNVYVYSPKDDPYLRAQWRQLYPADQLAVTKQLVAGAAADHVQFTYALSPGLSVCYSSDSDEQALVAKLDSMWNIGVRSFALPFDDISYTDWNCAEDATKFGTGGAAAGEAQAYLLDRVQHDFTDTHRSAKRLEMVPTEFSKESDSPYRTALRERLDPRIIVEWTGDQVVPATITAEQAAQAQQVFGHDILVWDNYPVNDYTRNRLLLGPYTGREAGTTDHVVGVTANPMIESAPSELAEFTSGDYLWNAGGYDPSTAWLAGLHYLGGSAWQALHVFAENNYSSILNATESPTLVPLISAFWKAHDSGQSLRSAATALVDYFGQMAAAPGALTTAIHDSAFLAEAKPWIDKLGIYGRAGQTAVSMLVAQQAGDAVTASKERLALESLMQQAAAIPQVVAPGVMDPFLAQAVAASNR
jgi:hypothetical protein